MRSLVLFILIITVCRVYAVTTVKPQQQEQSLADSDSDGNGVWDYMDQYIKQASSDEKTRVAMRHLARAIQGGLLNATDKKMSLEYARKSARATECLFFLHEAQASTMTKELQAAILNTKSRSKAYITFNKQLGGEYFQSTPFSKLSSSCEAVK